MDLIGRECSFSKGISWNIITSENRLTSMKENKNSHIFQKYNKKCKKISKLLIKNASFVMVGNKIRASFCYFRLNICYFKMFCDMFHHLKKISRFVLKIIQFSPLLRLRCDCNLKDFFFHNKTAHNHKFKEAKKDDFYYYNNKGQKPY